MFLLDFLHLKKCFLTALSCLIIFTLLPATIAAASDTIDNKTITDNSNSNSTISPKTENDSATIWLNKAHHFRFAGVYAAIEKGFYRDEGINVALKINNNPANTLIAGDRIGQYGISSGDILVHALNGNPYVLVSQVFQQPTRVFISLTSSKIKTIRDLRGKTIALSENAKDAPLYSSLLQTFNELTDITIQTSNKASVTQLLLGKIDALSISVDEIPALSEQGVNLSIIKPSNSPFYGDNVYTTEKEANQHPERVSAIQRATLKGWKYTLDQPEEMINIIQNKYMPDVSYQALKQQFLSINELILPNLFTLGKIERAKIYSQATAYKALGHSESSKIPNNFIFENTSNQLELTDLEWQWIRENPIVVYAAEKDWPPYDFIDSDGNHIGISKDYLDIISGLTGITFSPVVDSWNNLLKRTKSGEITLLPVITYTEKRSKDFIFSNHYGSNIPYFFAHEDKYNDSIDSLDGKSVAIPKSYGYVEILENNYPALNIVETDSLKSAVQLVIEGKVDFVLDSYSSVNYLLNSFTIASIKPIKPLSLDAGDGLYMAALKHNETLISIINKALAKISREKKKQVMSYWLGFTSLDKLDLRIQFSPQEMAWINQNKTIKFAGDPNWLPFEGIDENGNYIGIVPDYLKAIQERLGIEFEIVKTGSWQETLKQFKAGRIDVISETVDSPLTQSYSFSQGYLENPIVILMHDSNRYIDSIDQLKGKKIAIINDYGYLKKIKKRHENLDFYTVNNAHDGLIALKTGKVDAFICTALNATHHLSNMGLNDIRIVGKTKYKTSLGFLVSHQMRPLIPIINKAISNIDLKTKNKIIRSWTSEKEKTVIDYLIIWKVIAGTLIASAFLWSWIYLLRKEIRKRKASETYLLEANKRFTLAAEAASIGFWQFNVPKDGISEPTLIPDRVTLKLYDFEVDEQPSWVDIAGRIHDDDREKVSHFKLSAVHQKTKDPLKEQFRVVHPSGEIRHLYTAVINDSIEDNQKQAKLIGISWDVTELKESQVAMEKAKIEADNANRAKTEFLSNMSHEIRTPMNAILGFTELIDESASDKRTKSFVKTIRSAGNSLLAIINDILDLSKIEAGKMEIDAKPCDIYNLLDDISNIFRVKVDEKGIDIIIEFDPSMPRFVWLDEVRVRQILFNLMGNAVKFTEKGHIKIHIERIDNKNSISVLDFAIRVEDTGIGISDTNQHKIFGAFQQASGQNTREYGGTGLGLPISVKLARLMGGDVTLQSKEGQGSTFSLELRKVRLCVINATPKISQEENLDNLKFKQSKVLIVDDTENNRDLLISNLESKGFELKTANNGLEAVNLAKSEKFDIILMDIRMPIMDGNEAAQKIRLFSDVPIIALTASINDSQDTNENNPNFSSFLRKPVLRHQLYNEIAQYIPYEINTPPNQKPLDIQTYDDSSLTKTQSAHSEHIVTSTISKLDLGLLPDVIDDLNRLKAEAEALQKSNNIQEIELFNRHIGQLTKRAPIKSLQLIHEQLLQDLHSFDVGGIKKGLSQFCKTVDEFNTVI